jgi:RNA polymerase sigma-70 factor (ECF subfamily)
MPRPVNLLSVEHLDECQPQPPRLPCLSEFRAGLLARAYTKMGPQLRARVDPMDIVHETLLKALCARDQFRGRNTRQLKAWLTVILTNSIRNAVRSVRLTACLSERLRAWEVHRYSGEPGCPVRAAARKEELRRLFEAMAQLPGNQRFALELRFMDGCSLAEISDRTGRTRASVTGLLQRGLRAIRAQLHDPCERQRARPSRLAESRDGGGKVAQREPRFCG